MSKTKGKEVAPAKREPSDRERKAIAEAKESRKARPARAAFVQHPDSTATVLNLDCPHSDKEGQPILVAETFGTASDDFVTASILQLSNVTVRNKKPSVEGLNASLALIGAIAPENELEAALATQMAATHELSMEMLRRARTADTRDGMKDYANVATKLTRTFTAQMKTLSDWRRGGEQVVRHVHVYPGGQAVVAGTFNAGGYENEKMLKQAHEQGAGGTEMLGYDARGDSVPVPGDEGEDAVSAPRRKGDRRAKGELQRS